MEQTVSNKTASALKLDVSKIGGKFLVAISALSLVSIFYMNGTIGSVVDYFKPQPPNTPKVAGGPLFKTTQTTSASDVVTKALAFKAMLTTTQQSTLEQTYTTTLARKWSNLPCGATCRNGIQFGTLSSAELTAALEVIQAALGSNAGDGFEEFEANRMAEAYLHANGGGSGYDSTLRWIAFLNTPSTTGAWMLQFGGHHYAANIAFNNGHVVGATPFFQGVEPLSFTYNSVAYAPLNDEHDALTNMLASLSSTELATAQLSTSFSDCTMSPGESNGNTNTFPTTKVGIKCSALTSAQKALVLAAIKHYTDDMDTATANNSYARYESEIDETYIAYTGNGTSGTASSFLSSNSNYVRIDGPTVWIELSCQNGVVLSGIHYHTVWRDHSHDYGLDLTGPAIDEPTSVNSVTLQKNLNLYPNPASDNVSITLDEEVRDAKLIIVNAGNGQLVRSVAFSGSTYSVSVGELPSGMYVLKVIDENAVYTGKFSKL